MRKITFIISIMFVLCSVIVFPDGLESARDYSETNGVGITVDAVVSDIKKTDRASGDNNSLYDSYITYTVNGVEYEIKYQDGKNRKDIDSIGTKTTIEVNPQNPEQFMYDIHGETFTFLIFAPAISLLCLVRIIKFYMKGCTDEIIVNSADEQNTEQYFIKIMNCRVIRTYCFLLAVYLLVIQLCFRSVFNNIIFILILLSIFIILLVKDIRKLMIIKKSEHIVCKGTFEKKYYEEDNDSCRKSYYITYHYPKLDCTKNIYVSLKFYEDACDTDCSYLVFPPDNFTTPIMALHGSGGEYILTAK